MIGLLLAAALHAQAGTPADGETMTVEIPTTVTTTTKLHIPDEIAPAILPYFACRAASRGVSMRNERGEIPPVVEKGADCGAARAKAAKGADTLLKQQGGKSAAARRKMIDQTLASVDRFVPPLGEQVE